MKVADALRKTIVIGFVFSICAALVGGDYPYYGLLGTCLTLLFIYLIALSAGGTSRFCGFSLRKFTIASTFEVIALGYLINCWWLIVLTWIIGVTRGLILGSEPSLVLRNYFGMVVYCAFPILLLLSVQLRTVINIVTYAALAVLLYSLYSLETSLSRILVVNDYASLSELRVVFNYSTSAVVLFPLLAVSAASVFYRVWPQNIGVSNSLIAALSGRTGLLTLLVAIVIPSMSKGMALACIVIVAIPFFLGAADCLRRAVVPVYWLTFVLVAFVAWFFVPESFLDLVYFTYSAEETSNSLRSEQAQYLIDEFSALGAGLGAALRSGYVRDDTGYGFELNYLNLIHKLGVFSGPLFLSYFLTVMLAFHRILRRSNLFESYFALGLMAFLIIGAGNPVLLSPTSVMLHVFAIHTLLGSTRTLPGPIPSAVPRRPRLRSCLPR